MDDEDAGTQVRKVVVHRRVPEPRRPRSARAQRAMTGLRRTFTQTDFPPAFARPDRVVRTWGGSLAPWRLVAVGVIIILMLAFSWVRLFHIGPPSIEDLRRTAGVDEWQTLPIAVKDDQPGVAERDPVTGVWRGFDIDIAYMIAEDLGFRRDEVRFYGIESEDRARMEATDLDGKPVPVKMVIASYSITEEREREPNVMFTQSYLHTEQSVITLKGHDKVASLEEFRDKDVCSLSSSTSAKTADDSDARITRRNRISECFRLLDNEQVDAVTTDAAILGGYKARHPDKYDHWDLGLDKTEAWGVSVGANAALRDLVNITLYRSFKDPKDARWEQAYQNNILPETGPNKAADNGQLVPLSRPGQPVTARPRVRELPWEEVVP
ncbi:transporter substrate-binding domain-containing protein [Actinoplanes sp. NPDC048791]|uniref:transporter substrate-binding domain-containing protein n=1 Tax=Actinoplanes sp. NPDC048791 TaxID=3154623 RepID=UPI0033E130EC